MKRRNNNTLYDHWPLILFLAVYGLFVSWLIVFHPTPFFDWDEAIYAQVGREMMRQKSLLVPLWQGMPWLDKPPVPSLFYGLIELLPGPAEITTRLATLALSIGALVLLYKLALKLMKEKTAALLAVILTAFLPGFYQRSQALNVDVFLLIGWLGYVLWYEQFWTATGFLLLGVLSKSLLGYYPPLLYLAYHTFELLTRQMKPKEYLSHLKKIGIQILIASLWFIGMIVVYGYPFIQYQFIDSHFKRVASSIEQHFGQRTFYIDIIIDQLKWFLIPAVGTIAYLAYRFFRVKNDEKKTIFLTLFFLPWFLFLNLTKTKIAWYIYPTLPQFGLLTAYPIVLLKKNRYAMTAVSFAAVLLFFLFVVPVASLTGSYSRWEDHQRIAQKAHLADCRRLDVLVDSTTRTSYATLKSMDLVISTTTWWGNHPSIAYYADTKTTYLYDIAAYSALLTKPASDCFIVTKDDYGAYPQLQRLRTLSQNKTYFLLRK